MSFRMVSRFTLILSLLSLSSHSYGLEFGYDPLETTSPNTNTNITPSFTSHQFLAFNPEAPLHRVHPATFAQSDAPAHPRPASPLMFKGRSYAGKRVAESAEEKRMTNAERLARGLPVGVPRWARERSAPERRNNWPSTLPKVTVRAHVYCESDAGHVLGWLRPVWNNLGEYGIFSPDKTSFPLLEVELCYEPAVYDPSAPIEKLDLKTKMAPDLPEEPVQLDFIGGIVGNVALDSNIGPGSYGYGYIGGVVQTAPGAPPTAGHNSFTRVTGKSRDVESAIWTYVPATSALGLQWVNTDGQKKETSILYIGDTLLYTGDVAKWINTFGGTPEVLKCRLDKF